jgi:hypothetical protein
MLPFLLKSLFSRELLSTCILMCTDLINKERRDDGCTSTNCTCGKSWKSVGVFLEEM